MDMRDDEIAGGDDRFVVEVDGGPSVEFASAIGFNSNPYADFEDDRGRDRERFDDEPRRQGDHADERLVRDFVDDRSTSRARGDWKESICYDVMKNHEQYRRDADSRESACEIKEEANARSRSVWIFSEKPIRGFEPIEAELDAEHSDARERAPRSIGDEKPETGENKPRSRGEEPDSSRPRINIIKIICSHLFTIVNIKSLIETRRRMNPFSRRNRPPSFPASIRKDLWR